LGDGYSSNYTYTCDNCGVDDLMLDMISFSFWVSCGRGRIKKPLISERLYYSIF
jgi:hypothetical protein